MLHFLWSIILGYIAGWVASHLLGMHLNVLPTTILGIVGSVLGGLLARAFSKPADGAVFHPAGLILSIVGACAALLVWIKI